MWQGKVESIHVADKAQDPTRAVESVSAIPGAGLDGDRYARQQGTFSQPETDFGLTVAHNFVISPTLLNEVRGGRAARELINTR